MDGGDGFLPAPAESPDEPKTGSTGNPFGKPVGPPLRTTFLYSPTRWSVRVYRTLLNRVGTGPGREIGTRGVVDGVLSR